MPRGEIAEIDCEGAPPELYKIKYQSEDKVTYEVQNRGKKPVNVNFSFFDLENIALESERGRVDGDVVSIKVKPGETTHLVDVIFKDLQEGWHYNYDISTEVEDKPEWL
eukprot:TRINITY_DN5833_c0_g1_i2.p2 TRINITY_DN5833_c0_g1~~TRINITY_DN5833_c0_g1_i2.p2  ORF type:complete len:109 (+),score=36.95 TRINITY_DN5833_c0_g1_i2:91-417(+)